jgi:bifunctional non-homologous end joining protein LigD
VPPSERTWVEIGGRRLSVTNLDKVLYPLVGFTKAQVIDYYVRIAPTLLEHIGDRGVTLRRWPNGVNEQSFFEKRCPSHRPDWMKTCGGPGDRGGSIDYCCVSEVAALAWTANLAALEIHSPMARCGDIETPTMVVFDLDPGAPATIVECCQVALDVRDVLDHLGLESFAKTSGSKGMQLYVPLNTAHTHDQASSFALAIGQLLEKQFPQRVIVTMAKAARPNKIFVDWSQNSRHKTTIAPYSLRALERPTVSTPIDWDEVAAGAEGEPLIFEAADVLERIEERGDLFAGALTLEQELPLPRE